MHINYNAFQMNLLMQEFYTVLDTLLNTERVKILANDTNDVSFNSVTVILH